jgi:hypothetical protein
MPGLLPEHGPQLPPRFPPAALLEEELGQFAAPVRLIGTPAQGRLVSGNGLSRVAQGRVGQYTYE